MANERQELDRLRKIKRLRELELRAGVNSNVNNDINLGGLSIASAPDQSGGTGAVEDKGVLDSIGEFFTGSDRQTRATKELPEIGSGGLLSGQNKAVVGAISPALLTATNPQEIAQILTSNFDGIGITEDPKGNLIANNNETGVRVVLNQPGVSQLDIMQGLGIAAAFTPAGRGAGALAIGLKSGATSAGVEALQALSGGEFDASQVAIDAVTAGVLDKAFEVAKSTGRSIKNVLRDDAKIDPDQLIKSFDSQGFNSSFSKQASPSEPVSQSLKKVTQADLTPVALAKIRQAEGQGVQLTKAQATKDFSASDAEQTLLKSASTEGNQARQFADQQQEQLQSAAKSFTDKFGGSARLTETTGEIADITARDKGAQIQAALQDVEDFTRKEVNDLYSIAAETAGDEIPLNNSLLVGEADEVMNILPVTKEVRDTIDTALAKFGLIGDSVQPLTRNLNSVIDGKKRIEIVGGVTPLTLKNAEAFRQQLNQAVSSDTTGAAKRVVNNLDAQVNQLINEGAESGADTGRTQAFKAARDAFADKQAKFGSKDVIQDLVGFKKGTKTAVVDPETVIAKIAKGDKAVTNIRKVKKILLENPNEQTKKAWRSIQAETVGDILSQAVNKDTLQMSGARLNTAMKKYKPEALRELLGKKQYAELKRLQATIGDATIAPPGTTNPSGTFTKLLNNFERLGNAAGAGQFNVGSLIVATAKKGKEISTRKKTLDGIVNTKIETLSSNNPSMSRSSLEKAARTLAFLEIRELDKKENNQ